MAFEIFSVPCRDSEEEVRRMNDFIRSHRVLGVDKQLIVETGNSFWSFCIEYTDAASKSKDNKTSKIDYRDVLSERHFARFVRLRNLRKKFAEQEKTPAFTIFTNEQLAELAKMDQPSKSKMESIPGVNKARIEKYGDAFSKKFPINPWQIVQ